MENKIEIYLIVFFISFLLFFTGVVALFIQYKNKQKFAEKQKLMMEQLHQQELLSTQLEMQTQTMQHIGREIHDNVGQKLTLASLYTQQLAYENKAPQINDKIENIGNIINESLAELRQLSKSLTDDAINDNNINELLQLECNKVNELKKCHVIFNSRQKNIVLPYQTKSILLRIVQEFLQNSIKHANCKTIQVNLNNEEKSLHLNLQDDGKGFKTNTITVAGIGLNNMKKRTELIGGNYFLESKINAGTIVNITIPL
jgi:signal transduction histidine kinase